MVRRRILQIAVLSALATAFVETAAAEFSLDQLRTKFESAIETAKLERGVKILKLRDGYVGALERLKGTLGREEKLSQAAQVLKEIENVKSEKLDSALPDDADYRLANLRNTWKREQTRLDADYRKKIASLVDVYLETLDDKKKQLTRAGKIREALAIGEETGRVREIPDVKAVLEPEEPTLEKEDPGDLKTFLPGKTYSYEYDRKGLKTRKISFLDSRTCVFTDDPDTRVKWLVRGRSRKVTISHRSFQSSIELEFSPDGKSYDGTHLATKTSRRGKLVVPKDK